MTPWSLYNFVTRSQPCVKTDTNFGVWEPPVQMIIVINCFWVFLNGDDCQPWWNAVFVVANISIFEHFLGRYTSRRSRASHGFVCPRVPNLTSILSTADARDRQRRANTILFIRKSHGRGSLARNSETRWPIALFVFIMRGRTWAYDFISKLRKKKRSFSFATRNSFAPLRLYAFIPRSSSICCIFEYYDNVRTCVRGLQ